MRITEHAENRAKERIGLNKSAIERTAAKALEKGKKHGDYSGRFKRYLDGLFLSHKNANNMRVYGGHVYLFHDEILVTVFIIPNAFKGVK